MASPMMRVDAALGWGGVRTDLKRERHSYRSARLPGPLPVASIELRYAERPKTAERFVAREPAREAPAPVRAPPDPATAAPDGTRPHGGTNSLPAPDGEASEAGGASGPAAVDGDARDNEKGGSAEAEIAETDAETPSDGREDGNRETADEGGPSGDPEPGRHSPAPVAPREGPDERTNGRSGTDAHRVGEDGGSRTAGVRDEPGGGDGLPAWRRDLNWQ